MLWIELLVMAGYEVLFGIRNRIRTLCRRPVRSRAHNLVLPPPGSFLDGDKFLLSLFIIRISGGCELGS